MLTSPSPAAAGEVTRTPDRARRRTLVLLGLAAALGATILASLALGVRDIHPADVWDTLVTWATRAPLPDDQDTRVVLEQRLPRTIVGITAGAALALAGTLVQGVTRNPIADPGLLGLNAGASLAIVCSALLLGVGSPLGYIWFAFAGSAAAALLVFSIGAGRPVRLALVGATVTALLTPLVTLVLMQDQEAFNLYRFWAVGSLAGVRSAALAQLWPFVVVGLVLSVVMANRLNMLALGDDVAAALGQRVGTTRVLSGLAIVLLSGTATALAGPIALVGLAVPHAARRLVGTDYRWIVAVAVILGPVMLLGADVAGRLVLPGSELEAGVVAALVGAPVLVAVARGRSVAGV
ncbi:FecCD family ABC transporter permease [Myceligenerans crystallogenes]|uniref:Iron chelate uptake ABC transporter family permease subunit n=1 Tax=Myceligenerans crystallogenes TaxID=316335 RepID=A0ABP4ZQ85_9MICO